jgi:hypothetical protein
MKQRFIPIRITAVSTLLLASACGPQEPSPLIERIFSYNGPGRYDTRKGSARFDTDEVQPVIEEFSRNPITREERDKLCAIEIAQEEVTERLAFLEELNSRWRKQDGTRIFGFEIEYSMRKRTLEIGSGFMTPMLVIRTRRACVSRPIPSGNYEGFRLIELEEDGLRNSTYVFAAKLVENPLHDYPMLLLTRHAFAARGQKGRLRTLDWALRSPATNKEEGSEIWVFPHRLESGGGIAP